MGKNHLKFRTSLPPTLIFLVILCTTIIFQIYTNRTTEHSNHDVFSDKFQQITFRHNPQTHRFSAAKKMARWVYSENKKSFYCGCNFTKNQVTASNCDIENIQKTKQARRIEWEHIVPASKFGKNLKPWRHGDPKCTSKSGKPFKGRRCARSVSQEFNRLESDLYNLVPAIGEINRLRSNLPLVNTTHTKLIKKFGSCETFVFENGVVPRPSIRGWIARASLYMHYTYKNHNILNLHEHNLFIEWFLNHSPQATEKKIAQRIFRVQGNHNPFISQYKELSQIYAKKKIMQNPKSSHSDHLYD